MTSQADCNISTHGLFSPRSSTIKQNSRPGRDYFLSKSRRFLIETLKIDKSPSEVEAMVNEYWDGLDETEKEDFDRKAMCVPYTVTPYVPSMPTATNLRYDTPQ